MKRLCVFALAALLLLSGCTPAAPEEPELRRFEASFLELFDTVTTIVGYAPEEADFRQEVETLKETLTTYHRLFDIYNSYEGLNNLKTINDNAGVAPVRVDEKIIDLLTVAQELYESSGGKMNVAMGSVLSLWHESREAGINDPENAALPDRDALAEAGKHRDFSGVVIDREASTVYLPDPQQKLDVGAIAKGYALEQACKDISLPMIVSLGGNVRVVGQKPDGSPWVVGVQNPDDQGEYLHTLYTPTGSVVTSGDYQRYYTVSGKKYHHIIDPETGYPADRYRAVTVLCPDSGLADGLSTALFTMSIEEGTALLEKYNASAMWVMPNGEIQYSQHFSEAIRT